MPEIVYGRDRTPSREKRSARAIWFAAVRTLVDPADPKDVKQVHSPAGRDQGQPAERIGRFEMPNWDQASQKKVRDALAGARRARCPTSRMRSAARMQVDPVRHLIGTAAALGRQSRQGRDLSQRHAVQERRQDDLQADVKDVPVNGFWSVSVYNANGYLREEPVQRLLGQQHHRGEERRRFDCHPVRRLRRQNPKLPADHEGLELHGAALSAARRNPERHLEIPGAAAGRLRDRI